MDRRHTLRLLAFLALPLTSLLATTTLANDDMIPMDLYFETHPAQQSLAYALAQKVRKPAAPSKNSPDNIPLSISVIYPGIQTSDYWRRNLKAFKMRLDELKVKYKLTLHSLSPDEDATVIARQFASILKENPDYLITTLDSPQQEKMIEFILASGTTKVILQNVTTPIKSWVSAPPLAYIGFDHQTGTRLLVDFFAQHYPGPRDYGLVYFRPGLVSRLRGDYFIEQLQKDDRFNLLSSYYTQGTRKSAEDVTKELLANHPHLDFIYACSTDVALGALDAMDKLGRKVPVNGWGGGAAELDAIQQGRMVATVMRMNDDAAIAMAEIVNSDRNGEAVPQVFGGDFRLVTPATPADKIEEYRDYAFRYSDKNE
ncbi:substrate-binding domain-containing protein [Pokkaliibacter sp. CJK22405]|uniref:substrate-binding domain-containing protein n=1 Tax=Pokkaliibacter sp. CJK22405 TaxID=3384615 RepID=UPI003985399D